MKQELTFKQVKLTKNTVRYDCEEAAIGGSLYIQQSAMTAPYPQEIQVTVAIKQPAKAAS